MTAAPRAAKTNNLGLEKAQYKGADSTLCAGCGHDAISAQIINAFYELSINPTQVIKLSGIGCSSKTPAYWLNRAHGFNTVHGRMPSVATGAMLANRSLTAIGASGDGDTGSIGLGQFKHMIRRNVPMLYIIEDNGVYGLTKGQFSATADEGQKLKYAGLNELPPLDLCMEAIIAGCGYVARSFSGDPKQVAALMKGALAHNGTAVIDIISPCVTFNNHEESTKGYDWGKNHREILQDVIYVMPQEQITVDYAEGETFPVKMHDGSTIILHKLDKGHDPRDKYAALQKLEEAHEKQEFITGLLYVNENRATLQDVMHLTQTPLTHLGDEQLRPNRDALKKVMADLTL